GVAELLSQMDDATLLLITADHGNDPTFRGTDHTREYVPVLACAGADRAAPARCLGERASFADVGATAFAALTGAKPPRALAGRSFLHRVLHEPVGMLHAASAAGV